MKRILSIDGFRAISIALVIVDHALNKQKHAVNQLIYMLGNGALGVFIFL